VNQGTYDLDCRPGAPKESVRRPRQPASRSEQQQQQQQQQQEEEEEEEQERQPEHHRRRSSSCNDAGLRTHEHATKVPPFNVGDKVDYYSQKHRSWTPAVVLGLNGNGTYWLDCKRNASVLKIQHRGPRRMSATRDRAASASQAGQDRSASASQAGQDRAASASQATGCPSGRSSARSSGRSQDSHGFEIGEVVEYHCLVRGGWVNATIVSANEDGSYRLDVKVDALPKTLRRAGEEATYQTRIPEDAMKTRLPADWLEDEFTNLSQEQHEHPRLLTQRHIRLPQRRQKHSCWPLTP